MKSPAKSVSFWIGLMVFLLAAWMPFGSSEGLAANIKAGKKTEVSKLHAKVIKKASPKPKMKARTHKAQPSPWVVALQKRLLAKGFHTKADGFLGRETRNALRSFQGKHGLKATGRIDEDTLNRLYN